MRLPTNYRDLDLEFLDSQDLDCIELKARTLAFEDCLDVIALTADEIPGSDLALAKKVWRRGRANSIALAGDKLFSAMSMRNGGNIAFDYLKALSPTFQLEPTPSSGKSGSGFSFNVVLPDDKQAPPLAEVS